MLGKAGINVPYICIDDDNELVKFVNNVEIISPDKLKQLDGKKNIVVVIASYDGFIIDQKLNIIVNLELNTKKIFTIIALTISLIQNISDNRIKKTYRNWITFLEIFLKYPYKILFHHIRFYYPLYYAIRYNRILLYQPWKVGSISIFESLKKMDINCIHVHFLNMWKNIAMFLLKNKYKNGEKVKIITLVREPISRMLAQFFQLHFDLGRFDKLKNMIKTELLLKLEIGIKFFIYKYYSSKLLFWDYLIRNIRWQEIKLKIFRFNQFDWFDNELKAIFGVDIYAHPFDREKGYSIIKQGNIEVLAIKLEKLNTLEGVISEFINAPHFKLINANEGENKYYKYLYKNVKENIKIPVEIFKEYYENNPKMDHFYTEEEKTAFMKKWEKI